ncbi:MAG: protocatechuate 3,4-dioxygenase [Planctomycetota bacterium]
MRLFPTGDRSHELDNDSQYASQPNMVLGEISRRNWMRTGALWTATAVGGIAGMRLLGERALGDDSVSDAPIAEQLMPTVGMTEGPFFPDKLPLDTDNDLLIINENLTRAVGTIAHLTGTVVDSRGKPLRGATVEIWQCDANGAYIHSRSGNRENRDGNFQGYGRFLTDSRGRYYFRTIRPVPYPGRTPHIHFAVNRGGKRLFTTQMLIEGEAQNGRDGVFRNVRDPKRRKTVTAKFIPMKDSALGEQRVEYRIVLGKTLRELADGWLG